MPTTEATRMDPELEALAAEAFGRAFVVVGHLTRLADAGLEDWGLTSRGWLLLAVVARGLPDRAPSLSEAAAAYGTSRQNVKQIAVGLEARGFLRLVPDEHDGRTTRLVLTDRAGIFDTPEGLERTRALFASVFDDLSRDEIAGLATLLGRWLATLGRTSPEPPHASRKD